jgi:hypothetical protein
MAVFTALIVLSTCATPFIGATHWLAWPVVAVWGASGGALYTLAMVDIGAREKGITLVNSTAVLVLTYTLGGLIASALSGLLLEWSMSVVFPAMLMAVSLTGLLAQLRQAKA